MSKLKKGSHTEKSTTPILLTIRRKLKIVLVHIFLLIVSMEIYLLISAINIPANRKTPDKINKEE